MLLSLMRKHAQSWIIKFLIGIIVVVFILYFGYSFRSDEGIKVAEVNGESIGRVEYDKAYRDMLTNLQNEYKSVWSDKLIETFDLKRRALETLIEQKVISQEAERLGLRVTKNEIRDKILEIPAFITDGRFDESRYRYMLSSSHLTPEDFEESYSINLLQQKLAQFLTTFLLPNDQEILDNYRYSNEKTKLAYIMFSPDEFSASVQKDKEAVKSFFEERKENYRIPEKIKIAYIRIDPESFNDQVKLDEETLKGYYEDNIDKFTQEEQVKARHILFGVSPEASPEEQKKVEDIAGAVLERVKKGEDFGELAKEFSEDATKSTGGDLGYITKGSLGQGSKEFEDAAFGLKKDEISGLVKTAYGYHIIKVDDRVERSVKTFDEARNQIDGILRHNATMDIANEKGLFLTDQMPYDVDLKEFAADHKVAYDSTDFFSESEPVPMIRGNSKLIEILFSLNKGEVNKLEELNNEFYIIQILDKKGSYLPVLDEVYGKAEADYIDHMALESAKAEAEKYLKALSETGKWEELAKEKNRIIESSDYFTRSGTAGKIGVIPGMQEEAFKLNANNPFPDKVFENEKGAYIIKWEEKQDIDAARYIAEKERYAESLSMRKRQEAFSGWLDAMKAKSDIDVTFFESIK